MKKILIITICCFLIIALLGCQTSNVEDNSPNDDTESPIDIKETEIKDSEETENDSYYPVIDPQKAGEGIHGHAVYRSFEEACKRATDVVVATFEGYGETGRVYCFSVKDRLLGNAPEKIGVITSNMNVFVNETVGVFNEAYLFLELNKDYLLILENSTAVYDSVDMYNFIYNIIIDVENISDSTMYNQPLALHSKNFDFSKADRRTAFDYVKKLVKDNPTISPVKFAADPSMEDVIAESTDVLVVRINECTKHNVNQTRDIGIYDCKVLETLKGSIASGLTIEIVVKYGDVIEGSTVIIALDKYDGSKGLTSRNNSIIPVEQKEAAKAIIENEK